MFTKKLYIVEILQVLTSHDNLFSYGRDIFPML